MLLSFQEKNFRWKHCAFLHCCCTASALSRLHADRNGAVGRPAVL